MKTITASFAALFAAILITGCATQWIDKVSQTRASAAAIGYRAVSEFNAYYHTKTNALHGTTQDLEAARSLTYDASRKLSASLLTLETVELAYRAAPTNQLPVINAINAVGANASNLTATVKYVTQ
jgi:hypothetical protein